MTHPHLIPFGHEKSQQKARLPGDDGGGDCTITVDVLRLLMPTVHNDYRNQKLMDTKHHKSETDGTDKHILRVGGIEKLQTPQIYLP